MRVFVTGATGYIGSAVAAALQKAGLSVSGLARTEEKARKLGAQGIEAHRGDLRDPNSIAEGARLADAVIHCGMTGYPEAPQVDRAAVEAILRGIADFNRPFVYTSGCWILGNTGDQVADEDSPIGPTPLVVWRVAVEQLALEAAQRGVQSVVLRPAMVYGLGGGLVASLTQSARENGAASIVGKGENRWTFVHVNDLADLYVRALDAPAGTLLYAAHGSAVRVREVAEAASRAAGAGGKVEHVPLLEARKTNIYADALMIDQQISGERAKRMLGWRPQAPSVIEELSAAQA